MAPGPLASRRPSHFPQTIVPKSETAIVPATDHLVWRAALSFPRGRGFRPGHSTLEQFSRAAHGRSRMDRGRVNRRSAVRRSRGAVSYTHLRAHETVLDLVCRLLLE